MNFLEHLEMCLRYQILANHVCLRKAHTGHRASIGGNSGSHLKEAPIWVCL